MLSCNTDQWLVITAGNELPQSEPFQLAAPSNPLMAYNNVGLISGLWLTWILTQFRTGGFRVNIVDRQSGNISFLVDNAFCAGDAANGLILYKAFCLGGSFSSRSGKTPWKQGTMVHVIQSGFWGIRTSENDHYTTSRIFSAKPLCCKAFSGCEYLLQTLRSTKWSPKPIFGLTQLCS